MDPDPIGPERFGLVYGASHRTGGGPYDFKYSSLGNFCTKIRMSTLRVNKKICLKSCSSPFSYFNFNFFSLHLKSNLEPDHVFLKIHIWIRINPSGSTTLDV
jgi:hypothetical protein